MACKTVMSLSCQRRMGVRLFKATRFVVCGLFNLSLDIARDLSAVNSAGFLAFRCESPNTALRVLDEPRFAEVGPSPGRPVLQFCFAGRSVRHFHHFLRQTEQLSDLRHEFVYRRATTQAFQRLDRGGH